MISKLIRLILCCSICSFFTNGLPQVIRIGGIYPITNILNAKINKNGAQWLAGSLMAMRDLNSDPQYIASNIEFKLAVRDSRKTFSNTVVGCLDLAQTVFKSSGSHVIVGAGDFRLQRSIFCLRNCHHYQMMFYINYLFIYSLNSTSVSASISKYSMLFQLFQYVICLTLLPSVLDFPIYIVSFPPPYSILF